MLTLQITDSPFQQNGSHQQEVWEKQVFVSSSSLMGMWKHPIPFPWSHQGAGQFLACGLLLCDNDWSFAKCQTHSYFYHHW